ncbi:MAG: DUF924 family protein [Myxococcales bacterium]|nr:DUF924 family protein [Myxococcales bacterium]
MPTSPSWTCPLASGPRAPWWASPLISLWFASGKALDEFCQPFAAVVRELRAEPPSLIGEEWDILEGKVAKVLLAGHLSRSCFRGSAEAFSYDPIGRDVVRELVRPETLRLPGAILCLLPWALAHIGRCDGPAARM